MEKIAMNKLQVLIISTILLSHSFTKTF